MKKILFSTHFLHGYSGSELSILALAGYFQKNNWDVTVVCLIKGELLNNEFDKIGVKVITLPEEIALIPHQNFDIYWCQHYTSYYQVTQIPELSFKKVVFSSLSPFEAIETPPIVDDQIHLYLSNSVETQDALIKLGINKDKIHVFPNFITEDDLHYFDKNRSATLKKIAVISNHVPREIYGLTDLLKEEGLSLTYYGEQDHFTLIDAKELEPYDAVITIGRTTQLALAMGIPVFSYDRYFGSGWITEDNITQNALYNFSGRGVDAVARKPNKLRVEFLKGFEEAFSQRTELKEYVAGHNDLHKNIQVLHDKIQSIVTPLISTIDLYQYGQRKSIGTIRLYEYQYSKIEDIKALKALNHKFNRSIIKIENSFVWKISRAVRATQQWLLSLFRSKHK